MFKRKSTYVIIVIAIFLILLYKPYRECIYKIAADFFYPYLSFPNYIDNSITKKSYLMKSKHELVSQILKMQKSIFELDAQNTTLRNIKKENDKLRKLLNIKQIPNYKYIFAELIYRDPARWDDQFVINKGSDEGIQEGAIVLGCINDSTQFGVVGRIGPVSKHTSVVYTIVSNECQISVMIPSDGATGILHGAEKEGEKLYSDIHFLPKDIEYKKGSLVITSGLTSLAPRGLTIGKLINHIKNNFGSEKLFVTAKIEPAVDLNQLDFVLVLGKNND